MTSAVPRAAAEWLSRLASGGTGRRVVIRVTESGALLGIGDAVVVKVHRAGTEPAGLTARLAAAGDPGLAGLLAAPLEPHPRRPPAPAGLDGRLATLWPRLTVLCPDGPEPPWADAASLLARLHLAPAPAAVTGLAAGGPSRLRRALARLPHAGDPARRAAAGAVLAAGGRVEAELAVTRYGRPCLVHGDWHLGQVGRGRDGGWSLLDVDDVGLGDPAWDLARPAGFWAAGLLADEAWAEFLLAYRSAGGPAVPPRGDPWPRLDLPARAEVVVAAARALRGSPPHGWDDTAEALVAACARMGAAHRRGGGR